MHLVETAAEPAEELAVALVAAMVVETALAVKTATKLLPPEMVQAAVAASHRC